MIHICRITDISQTTCILRSIPAHFLQLLRDGALRGRTCGRHGLTLNIFFFPLSSSSVLLISVCPPWSAEMVWSLAGDPSSQHRPPSPRFGVHAAFRCFFCARVCHAAHLSISVSIHAEDMSAVKWSIFVFSSFSPLERVDARGAPLARLQRGSGNFTDDAKRTKSAQTNSREHVRDILCM